MIFKTRRWAVTRVTCIFMMLSSLYTYLYL